MTAKQRYRGAITTFLNARTTHYPGALVNATVLYQAWIGWCNSVGIYPVTQTAFGRELGEREMKKKHTTKGGYYLDIRLNE